MADVMKLPRWRVNASILAQFIAQPVCFVGRLEKIHTTGKMFILSDGEGKNETIESMEPLNEEISGIIEVIGRVTAKAVTPSCVHLISSLKKIAVLLILDFTMKP
ncbi:Replication protein A 14 kDa subunit [Tupaia chinensis]|uniref:Replication protein A 14 kDa subunit n=1 Tax=Tupaia chinensis TaxID=246437 RepID=L9KFU1_TUPCH|nr:Replication protein A 14 kDa subunit [Tupaia chinensis]